MGQCERGIQCTMERVAAMSMAMALIFADKIYVCELVMRIIKR